MILEEERRPPVRVGLREQRDEAPPVDPDRGATPASSVIVGVMSMLSARWSTSTVAGVAPRGRRLGAERHERDPVTFLVLAAFFAVPVLASREAVVRHEEEHGVVEAPSALSWPTSAFTASSAARLVARTRRNSFR